MCVVVTHRALFSACVSIDFMGGARSTLYTVHVNYVTIAYTCIIILWHACMAASESSTTHLEHLLGLATSSKDEHFYCCAACISLLEEVKGDGDAGTARETLLAAFLKQLESQLGVPKATWIGLEGGRRREGEGEAGAGAGEWWESVWHLCHEAAQVGDNKQKTLLSFVSLSRHFQVRSCQLTSVALAIGQGSNVLQDTENLNNFLLQYYEQFWSIQIDLLAKHIGSVEDEQKSNTITGWYRCIQSLVLLHILNKIYEALTTALQCPALSGLTHTDASLKKVQTVTSCDLFLCESISTPLVDKLTFLVPRILHRVYSSMWSRDMETLNTQRMIPTSEKKGFGLTLKVSVVLQFMCIVYKLYV